MCRTAGVFMCPEVATTLVGIRRAVETGIVNTNDICILIGTATGLKSLSHVADPMAA